MKLHRSLAVAALLTAVVAVPAVQAQSDGDAAAGKELAQEWCVRCHNIEPDGPWKLYPPSFASIAMFRAQAHIRARIAFPPVHTNMPDLGSMLSPENVNDLVAYIVSLERVEP